MNRHRWRESDSRYELRMTPLVDVIFLLLVFFVCTAQFRPPEENLPAQVQGSHSQGKPQEVPPELEELDEVLVTIRREANRPKWIIAVAGPATGEKHINSLPELAAFLSELAQIESNLPVLVSPAADVPVEDVINTVDLCRQSGLRSVSLLTQAPGA
ncbi:MAG: biopolymer transporter ExbD [Thermoguttaceae bacterium]|nr:biopolymer transporter ExbD [Thermoguttaceae bacterium]MDW8079568.1 biopolymer transporter ExbD [Thermoguttaceae bacterium]